MHLDILGFLYLFDGSAPYRHLGIPVLVGSYTFGRVQSGIGVGRGGAAHLDSVGVLVLSSIP